MTTQPTPGALSAAREILDAVGFSYSAAGVFARTKEPVVAAIIDRHFSPANTARPDVDALVKALEVELADNMTLQLRAELGDFQAFAVRQNRRIKAALARHAKGGATG